MCNFRMTSDAAYDSLACHIDLLGYQKNEITDSVCKFVNVESPLLEEGLLLCDYALPVNNQDFKLFLRQFYQAPLDLQNFTLEVGIEHTVIRCSVAYDNCSVVSKPLFRFSNRTFRNVEMLRKQLQNLSFTYKISKSHLSFQIMQYGEELIFGFIIMQLKIVLLHRHLE